MARPKSKDPAIPVTITLPKSLRRVAQVNADKWHMTLSAFISQLIRDFNVRIELEPK